MRLTQGNLLKAPVQAIVNTVNTEGVMGKGLALQFREAFPLNYKLYQQACKERQVQVGRMFVTETGTAFGPQYIINFPTKRHWKEASRMHYITEGLTDLKRVLTDLGIQSVALPPLGCGNGGLKWEDVKPVIEDSLEELDGKVNILLFAPSVNPQLYATEGKEAHLTEARAMLLLAMRAYAVLGYSLTLLEVHKLGYFLHRLGENSLRLKVKKAHYGPYSENLNFLLQGLDGVYLTGMRYKEAGPSEELRLIDEKLPELEDWAKEHLNKDQWKRLQRLEALIEGFESPLGMELLASVDYLFDKGEVKSAEQLPSAVGNWSGRKAKLMTPFLLDVASDWLENAGLINKQLGGHSRELTFDFL